MSISILHCADIHLGLRFSDLGDATETLVEARYEALGRIVECANGRGVEILAVAGDMFDRISMKASEVERAAALLSGFSGGAVLVLPGNHDFASPAGTLWSRFRAAAGDHIILLDSTGPHKLDEFGLPVDVWAAPCAAKHSSDHAIAPIVAAGKDSARINIGIAHGSLLGVSPDPEMKYYPMPPDELESAGVDIWLLGHTHVPWPQQFDERIRIFNPGTPEPDGFSCSHDGQVFLHRLTTLDSGAVAAVESEAIVTGRYRFGHYELAVDSATDFGALADTIAPELRARTLAKVALTGRLEQSEHDRLSATLAELREELLYLSVDRSRLSVRLTAEEIARHYPDGSFPARLLSTLAEEGAYEEMEVAFELLEKVRTS